MVRSTASGLMLANDMSDVRAYAKSLSDQLVGGVAPTDAASSTGSVAAMVKYQIANPPAGATPASVRDLYVPLGTDTWGIHGARALGYNGTAGVSPVADTRNAGWGDDVAAQGSALSFLYANPAGATRPPVARSATPAGINGSAGFISVVPGMANGNYRQANPNPTLNSPQGYDTLVLEISVVPTSTATIDHFFGWFNGATNTDPFAATNWVAITSEAAVSSGQWKLHTKAAGTASTLLTGAALVINTPIKFKLRWKSGILYCSVNGAAEQSLATNVPTALLWSRIACTTRSAASVWWALEYAYERLQTT